VLVAVGTQDLGTGTRTFTRAIVAEELGLQIKDVVEQIGNSKLGSANSSEARPPRLLCLRQSKMRPSKTRLALARKMAPLLGNAKPEEIAFAGGNVTFGGKSLTWKQACAHCPRPA